MKTTITTLILSVLAITSVAQPKEYYKNSNILKVNGIDYAITIESIEMQDTPRVSFTGITEKDSQGKDFSSRTKNGELFYLKAFANTCEVINSDMIFPIVKRILNKYGFDIYNKDGNIPSDDHTNNRLSMHIYFNVDNKKVETVRFNFRDSSKANTVPIEAYDEIIKELKRTLICIPNEIGKQLIYCNVFYSFVLK